MQKKNNQFSLEDLPPEQAHIPPENIIRQIKEISKNEFGRTDKKLDLLAEDVIALYDGKWQDHEACQVGYHNIHHCLAVGLATSRMVSGWNKENHDNILSEPLFLAGIAAAFLHDSGYLKDKKDQQGHGGKYTFSHVARSRDLAHDYLKRTGWNNDDITLVCRIIDITEFGEEPNLAVFQNDGQLAMAKIVASADLIAQLADINYLRRLQDLYDEFEEGYEAEGRSTLRNRSIHIYASFAEMLNKTPEFYEHFVLPRLQLFDRMDKYLASFFADGRNPYFESITANISGQLLNNRFQWQRLGDILLQHGLVEESLISEALFKQQSNAKHVRPQQKKKYLPENLSEHLLHWLQDRRYSRDRLGDILMEMKAVDPQTLRAGLLTQILPEELIRRLSRQELLYLLRISLLVQNLYDDPWIFSQILEMTLETMNAEAASLLLANREKTELLMAVHAGPKKNELEGKSFLMGNGLSGWVFHHGRSAYVSKSIIADQYWDKSYSDGSLIDSILAVPIHIEGDIIGVVEIINKKETNFNDHDADILTLLANVMASSLSLVSKLQVV